MSKLFLCPCGKKWRVFVGNGESSLCCKQAMTPVDDGGPLLPTRGGAERGLQTPGERQ